MTKRTKTGQFQKGISGNLSGRPKTEKLTQKDRDHLVKLITDNVKDKNLAKEALIFMCERANLLSDVHKYFKEYVPYLSAKLSSVKAEIQEDKTITIRVEGFGNIEHTAKETKIINQKKEGDK